MGQGLNRLFFKRELPGSAVEVFGIRFQNRIGLKSGSDKNAARFYRMRNSMYGFISLGPLVPEVPVLKKVISSVNAHECDVVLNSVLTHKKDSRDEDSLISDFCFGLSMMYDFTDMFTVDATTTNPDHTKPLQDISVLTEILDALLQLRICYETYKPIIVAVNPDISPCLLDELVDWCRMSGIDGICISDGKDALGTIKHVHERTLGRFPIIAKCPVLKKSTAAEFVSAGAYLVAGGTSFFRRGALYTKRIIKSLL